MRNAENCEMAAEWNPNNPASAFSILPDSGIIIIIIIIMCKDPEG